MVLGIRKCRRKSSLKKIVIVLFCCSLVAYIGSVIHRTPQSRAIWDPVDFQNVSDGVCGVECPYGQVSFYIKTGVENKQGPTICFQNKVWISDGKKNVNRGLNVVIVNDKTLEAVATNAYDTYITDNEFVTDMTTAVKEGHVLIVASYDDMSENLKAEGRRWLKLFGSESIDQVSFRDSFVMIGQKGLKQGHAIEFLNPKGSRLFATPVEKTGCFSLPLGPVLPIKDALPQIAGARLVPTGDPLDNCGLEEVCPREHYPVMVYTGKDSTEFPEVCVSGKMILRKGLNDAGRGMNFVIVDALTGNAKALSRFDTYEKDSTDLEQFLEGLSHGDIVLAVSFDDSSRKLSFHARELLNQLGSSMAQNIKFRDVWYFIGQKGIDGFTHMEMISYAGMENEWPKPLRGSYCVPAKIKGAQIIPDPPATRNDAKRAFCKKYDGYGEFCDASHVDDPLIKPVLLVDESLQRNPVYSSPIIIIPGMNHNALVGTLQTTVMQPGVDLRYVLVTWDEKFPEQGELAELFGFRNLSIASSTSYTDQTMKSIEKAAGLFTNSQYMIVLEEELLLSPDFLYFMSQCVGVLEKDATLYGVSAFNYNGFEYLSNNKSLVYRVQEFPGLAFIIKMAVYQRMKGGLKACCNGRAWEGWSIPTYNRSLGGEMLVPDISRAHRQQYEGSQSNEEYLVSMFNRPRVTNVDRNAKLLGLDSLTKSSYSLLVMRILEIASPIDPSQLKVCVSSDGKDLIKLKTKEGYYSVYYKQKEFTDYTTLIKLCRCFGLFGMDQHRPKNLYQGILRFTYMDNNIIFVGSHTQFDKYKPHNISAFDA